MRIFYETGHNGLMLFPEDECPASSAASIVAPRSIYKIETEGHETLLLWRLFKKTIPWAFSENLAEDGEVCDKQVWVGDIAKTIVESLKLQQQPKQTSEQMVESLKKEALTSLKPLRY